MKSCSLAVVSLFVVAVVATARTMDDGCSSVLYDMAGCMEYLTAGSNLTEPSDPECCTEFVTAMKTSRGCICDAVKYSNKIGLDISLTKANNLPYICHSHTHFSCEDYEASSWAPTPSMTPDDHEAEAPSPNSSADDEKHKKHAMAPAPAPAEDDQQSGVNSAPAIVSTSVLCSLALLFANSFLVILA